MRDWPGASEGDVLLGGHPRVRAFAPGRCELAGNHMDHQGGVVLSATVSDGITGIAAGNDRAVVRVLSDGYDRVEIALDDAGLWRKPQAEERNTTAALVRGVASSLAQMGVAVAGFDLRATSSLVAGGGMSSSAAFEMLCACVINLLFADGRVMPLDLARASLAAEREWYGKPCGLQDQAAIASGGISVLDFASPLNPVIRHLDFDFGASGYCVCLIDVGCDHSEHAEQFAAIPHDMFEAARFLGAEVLGGVGEAEYLARLPQLRGVLGDRIALRGLHFYREQRLVKRRVEALERGDIHAYLRDTLASSRSSAEYLQNVSDGGEEQPAMVVLALCDMLLDGRGAFRIHGGGFGGTVQAYVPLDMLGDFRTGIESQLGRDSCHVLTLGKEAAFAESI